MMKKVIIIGCPGSGKSTFARAFNVITDLPLFHLDNMKWNSDKTAVSKATFMERLNNAIEKEKWIIDGNYGSTMELRLQACDTVFFLDYPVEVCLKGIEDRKGIERPDMPWFELLDENDDEFVSFIKNYNVTSKPKVMELLNKYNNKDVIIFKSRKEATEYLNKIKE